MVEKKHKLYDRVSEVVRGLRCLNCNQFVVHLEVPGMLATALRYHTLEIERVQPFHIRALGRLPEVRGV